MKQLFVLLIAFLSVGSLWAQNNGTAYGIKGGLSLANQSWNGTERELMFGTHGALFLESVNDSSNLSLYAAIGYHERGSAIRIRESFNPNTMQTFPARTLRQPFRNISLHVGAKSRHWLNDKFLGYLLLGLRVEYTLDYSLAFQSEGFDMFVNDWNYGFSVGAGIEHEFANFPGAVFIELTFSPDLSRQVFLPGGVVVYSLPGSTNQFTFPEQKVINRTFELSVGYKFIRRVEWID